MNISLLTRATILAALATSAHSQQVLTVGGATGSFSTIQAAVDAASAGDTVLVKPGQHAGATVSQSLALVADGLGVELTSQLLIDGIAAGSTVLVHGFEVSSSALMILSPVGITNCAGAVWIEDCSLDVVGLFAHSVNVESSSAVTIQRSALGNPAVHSGAGSGISAQSSEVHVFDCIVAGGRGRNSNDMPPGIVAIDSFVYLHNTEVTGGQGGIPAAHCASAQGGDGGPAVDARGTSQVIELSSTFIGGPPAPFCGGPMGS